LIAEGKVYAVHDISDGGLLVALAEMCLAGGTGAWLDLLPPDQRSQTRQCFGEDQGRYVVQMHIDDWTRAEEGEDDELASLGRWIGGIGGDTLDIQWTEAGMQARDRDGWITITPHEPTVVASIPLADLRAAHEGFFPSLMGAEAALA
jgi:phosphoribosylformylglycinamidine synthase